MKYWEINVSEVDNFRISQQGQWATEPKCDNRLKSVCHTKRKITNLVERVEIEENVHLKMRFFDIFNPEYESLPEDPEFRPLGERREKLCTKND